MLGDGVAMEGGGGGDLLTTRHLEQVASVLLSNQKQYYKSSDDELLTPEDDCIFDYLDKSNDKAEARLAARRQARAEAREIRMRELERQQKEIEENADRVYDMYTEPVARSPRVAAVTTAAVSSPRLNVSALAVNNSYHNSRRSSEDSLEETGSMRDVRHELKEVEEKFRKAMIQNAQLDNEKASLNYQVELLKDRLEDLDEAHSQLQREHKEKCRVFEQLKRTHARLQEDMQCCKMQLDERDELITNHGLQIVGGEDGDTKRVLVSVEGAQMLQGVGQGSLDVRLRRLAEERSDLADQVRRLKMEMEEGRSQSARSTRSASTGAAVNGVSDSEEAQRETNKVIADYRFKLQKAEQDVSTLQANVARLESQVVRYKGASESSEKVEDELKVEKRKLQREGSQDMDASSASESDVNDAVSDVDNVNNDEVNIVDNEAGNVKDLAHSSASDGKRNKESNSRSNMSEGNEDSDNDNTDCKNIPDISEDCEKSELKGNVQLNENSGSFENSSKSSAPGKLNLVGERSESKETSDDDESDNLDNEIDNVKDIDNIEESVDKSEENVDKIEENVDKIEEYVDKIEESVDKIEESVDKIEENVDKIEEDVDKTEDNVDKIDKPEVYEVATIGLNETMAVVKENDNSMAKSDSNGNIKPEASDCNSNTELKIIAKRDENDDAKESVDINEQVSVKDSDVIPEKCPKSVDIKENDDSSESDESEEESDDSEETADSSEKTSTSA